ncbi:MAG: PD-(D/E)XK nuclease family protein [Deltaproteobacteria bacterium]|nr:PD-(D/E)XK nuclease family protein [Deltaproteobacteria bacterium]
MPARNMNLFDTQLATICNDYRINTKWLISPSMRIGFQWLDNVTRAGQPVLNVRVKTLQRAALELAMHELDQTGKRYLGRLRSELLVSSIFMKLKGLGQGYFTALEPSRGIIQAFVSTINDIRLSGIKAADLQPEVFEVEEKGLETQKILVQYEEELEKQDLVDFSDVLRIAIKRIENDPAVIPQETLVLAPQALWDSATSLEKGFLKAFPDHNLRIISEDNIGTIPEDDGTDRALLRKILAPADCPPPEGDGTAFIYRAIGEVNEVREVFRRCAEGSIPFDEVEILHTDGATYVPLIYELAWTLKSDEGQSIPATFAEGIPTSYSRPGRALRAWLSWIENDHTQWTLVRMIQDGTLRMDKAEEDGFSFSLIAATLRGLPIGAGAQRYLKAIDDQIHALEQPLPDKESDEDAVPDRAGKHSKRIECLSEVRNLVKRLLERNMTKDSNHKKILETAHWFLEDCCRCVNELDEYSKGRLQTEIKELMSCFDQDTQDAGFDIWEWLSSLPGVLSVAGQGPRPGCVYVATVGDGGHSGRKDTFILGLDDSKFPGAGLQDPLLLDAERKKISSNLPTSSGRTNKKVEDFARLLSRLRGTVTLCYCCRSLDDDREIFPSSVLMSAYRILSGNHDGDQDSFLQWLPDPISFAAQSSEQCSCVSEWWLWKTCGDKEIIDSQEVVAKSFPHLGQGMVARSHRQSDIFTEYDGWAPQAGIDLDPTAPDGPILSSSRLEKLGSCPLEYFFRYVLEVKTPEEYKVDPSVWLDPLQKGTLLHSVFREFMATLKKDNLLPDVDRHSKLMSDILDRQIKIYRDTIPPPSEELFNATVREFRRTTLIFLQEEALSCKSSVPFYFEAAIGLPQDGDPTPLDTLEPVSINLPNGKSIRTRGRIDRIDQLSNSNKNDFSVWDYKTGSTWGYDRSKPFRQGRRIQSVLYLALSEKRLKETCSPTCSVANFGYFFPGFREHGERISWESHQLKAGKEVLAGLVEMLQTGCFPFTTDPSDVNFTDYGMVFSDIEELVRNTRIKMENPANKNMEPFRKLRS